ncbi:hypothetical protein NDU88_008269 [Pleurodeles waltl]|uniref:CUB domain-containing protein n=2 Tax=Pleurodeles waltl TaxID=8319 RepID=A0AAV7U5L8_PLEWA|nr:hypothetical protein NDU88_008269 [Pleurodeles waltl]
MVDKSVEFLADLRLPGLSEEVSLHIGPVLLESSQRCAYDYVSVREEPMMASVQERRLCGKAPGQTFTSSANSLRVHFRSDESVQAGGFLASYSLSE